jgi:putative ABC transport system permease protein
MIKNYIKIAIRNLARYRIFTIINIIGLSTGLACCLFIAAYIYDELAFDRYPEQAGQLYRVGIKLKQHGGIADYPHVDVAVGAGMKNTYPEVLASTRVFGARSSFVRYGDKEFKEEHITFCDSNFLELFSIPLLEGNQTRALLEPNSIVISKAFEKKYFGDESAIGKALTLDNAGYKVTGIMDKVPDNSHFHFDAFMSMATIRYAYTGTTWSNIGFYTYLLLKKGADPRKLESEFPELAARYIIPETEHDMGVGLAEAKKAMDNWRFYLMPVTSIHLNSHTKYELDANSDILYVYIFGSLGIFILLLACVNYTNLATASAMNRAREVGIRKTLGTSKSQLIKQFLIESIALSASAMAIALVLVYLLLPYFNEISGKQIRILFFLNYRVLALIILMIIVTGMIAGAYPAFFLSSFQTVSVLKGAPTHSGEKKVSLRSGLVIFQFIISTALIISTMVVYEQLHYLQNKKLGYDKSQVLVVKDFYLLRQNQIAFKDQLLKDKRVLGATISNDVPVGRSDGDMDGSEVYAKEDKEDKNEIHAVFFHVDYDYIKTLGIQMAAGRYFSRDYASDSFATVINEATVRDLGWKDNVAALGKTIVYSGQHERKVIGVVQDFQFTSAKQKIAPLMMRLGSSNGTIMVKIQTADLRNFFSDLKKNWAAFNPGVPISYYFLDERFASVYAAELRTGQIFTVLALVAVLIASLGLFGLVSYTTQQRAKEVGIRKVLGATVKQVLFLLSKEFVYLVFIAFSVSIPVSWWAMNKWLDNFPYRIHISWWIFATAGAAALFTAIATVSFLAIKAAIANPVKSLKTE